MTLAFDIMRREKGIEIFLVLHRGSRSIKEIQRAVGGSNKALYSRVKELLDAGLATETYLTDETYGRKPFDRRLLQLTKEGKELAQSWIDSGFVRPLTLQKLREKWIIAVLNSLGVVLGKMRFMKILFLVKKECGFTERELAGFYQFRAGKYGPFSRGIEKDLEELQENGCIAVETRLVSKSEFSEGQKVLHIYRLAPEKIDIVQEALSKLPSNTPKMLSNIEGVNRLPLIDLLKYVYTRYPDYAKNSLIVERVLGRRS